MPIKDKKLNAKLAASARKSRTKPNVIADYPSAVVTPDSPHPAAGHRLLSKSEVIDRVGVSYASIWAWMREGRFPRSVSIGGHVAWFEHEIDQFLASLPRRVLKGETARAEA